MMGFGRQIEAARRRMARRVGDAERRVGQGMALVPERSADRYLGGVAGGIARLLDVDPLVVRLAFAVGALYSPWLVVLYTAAWILMPDARTGRSLLRSTSEPDGWPALLGVLALGIGAARLAPDLSPGGDSGLRTGVVLCVIGVMLLVRRTGTVPWGRTDVSPETPEPSPPPPADEDEPTVLAPEDRSRLRSSGAGTKTRRPPSYLGWFALSAVVLLVGVIAAIDYGGDATHVSPGVAVAVCLVVVGAALVLATWWGRARILLPVGVALLPLWVGWSMHDVPRFDGEGEVRYAVAAGEALPSSFEHGYGDMDIDLTRARFEAGDHQTLHVGLTAGTVRIEVPRDVFVAVQGEVGAGDVEVWDEWRVADSGLRLGQGVDLRAGQYQQSRNCFRLPVYPEVPPTTAQVPASPDLSTIVPPTTTTTLLEYEYRDRYGETCTPPKPVENPSRLDLDLEVGIGTVEVHRG